MPEVASTSSASTAEQVAGKPWFVYLVRAANGSLYCGISDDPQRRFAAHQSGK
ncbi:GIY-YIG nuclease super protein, partial [Pseudomonas syringae pv. atrofaciens]